MADANATSSERATLYLMDGHAIAYRQFYALQRTGDSFVTSSGEPTAAVYGFTRTLLDILEQHPTYLAVTFDSGLGGRDVLYPEYKAQRDDMPDDLDRQMERIFEIVQALNIPLLMMEGEEADDVIGTISLQAEAADVDTLIITGDRDLLQLLSDHVHVQLPQFKQPDRVFDVDAFVEKYQIQPIQLIDMKALMGDNSDNIPGVKGIGEKTATALLQDYSSLEEVYANLDSISSKSTRNKLEEGRDMAFLSKKLVTIKRDLPIKLQLDECVTRDLDPIAVDAVFADVEFNSLRERFRDMFEHIEFNEPFEYETITVRTDAQLKQMVEHLQLADSIVFDVESTSVDPTEADLVGLALSVPGEAQGYYIPVGHRRQGEDTLFVGEDEMQLELKHVIEAIRAPLTDFGIRKIAHNATYDYVVMARHGLVVEPITFDTMLAEWMRDPISNNLGLKKFAQNELEITMTEITDLIGKGKSQITMDMVAVTDAAPYAVADVVVTGMAAQKLEPALGELNMLDLFRDIEMPLVPIIGQMEMAGTMIDTDHLAKMSLILADQLGELEAQIYDIAGVAEFNINSPMQLNEILFVKLGLPTNNLRKTSHGYSTDAATLEMLKPEHEIIDLIVSYRELSKLKSTYVDSLPELINPVTGRIHTSYNQTGTSTGRFSSSNPNLQNIPIRTDMGREVRRAFIAPEGHMLLAVDYSQIELRIMAHVSQDATLLQAFHENQDIHSATAAAVFGVNVDEVTYNQRSFAKRVNFGLMYGMGPYRLARDSDLTIAEAEKFIQTYFERLPGVERYLEGTRNFAMDNGYVETLFGRRRFFPNLMRGKTKGQSSQAELRAAINMPIQGTAADILKVAMIRLDKSLREAGLPARMTLQVHDEVVLEVADEALEQTARLVVDTMEQAYEMSVAIVANAEVGHNWCDMEHYAVV